MTSQYSKAMEIFAQRCCETCDGTGEEDDAGCGDISFRTWKCRSCLGTGFKKTKEYPGNYSDLELIDMLQDLSYQQYDEGAETSWLWQAADLIATESIDVVRDEVVTSMSETSPSWKYRCESVLSILGLDFGQNENGVGMGKLSRYDKAYITALLARSMAAQEGRAEIYDRCVTDPVVEEEYGHYGGYNAEAYDLLETSGIFNLIENGFDNG